MPTAQSLANGPDGRPHGKPRLVVVGVSLGGLRALATILGSLPRRFPAAVAIAQHRRPDPDERLSVLLRRAGALPVTEAQDKEPIQAGRVYLAPADYHLLVEDGAFALSTEGPVSFARPSIDVLFETAADSFGEQVIAVVLTGANHDGARGAVHVRACGGCVWVQDPATAECPVMPSAVMKLMRPDHVLPLEQIGPFLSRSLGVEPRCNPSLPVPPNATASGALPTPETAS